MDSNSRPRTEAELIRSEYARALQELTSKDKFRDFFESTLIQDRSQYHLIGHLTNPSPSSQPHQVYEMLLSGGNELILQLNLFELAAFDIILDEEQFVRQVPRSRFTFGEFLLGEISESPNIQQGKWLDKMKEAIRLEDIVSGKIHHQPYDTDEPLRGQIPTYRHQKSMLHFLTGFYEHFSEDFWEQIVQNPSFVETEFMLAREREDKEAIELILPRLFRYKFETLAPEAVETNCYLSAMHTHIGNEEIISKFLEDPANELQSKLGGSLSRLRVNRPEMGKMYNQGDAIFMTGFERNNGNATIDYILIENGKLTRQSLTLNMNTESVLKGRKEHGPILMDFARKYETFVLEYRTALQNLK